MVATLVGVVAGVPAGVAPGVVRILTVAGMELPTIAVAVRGGKTRRGAWPTVTT